MNNHKWMAQGNRMVLDGAYCPDDLSLFVYPHMDFFKFVICHTPSNQYRDFYGGDTLDAAQETALQVLYKPEVLRLFDCE